LQSFAKGVGVVLTRAIFWLVSLVVMLAGGYIVAVGTPCLCADVNGFLLGGGLIMIVCGAAMLLWSKELARFLLNKLGSLAAPEK